MSEPDQSQKNAGTRYPFINLEKAIGRANELFDADQKGREMTIAVAFSVWSYSEKSSGGFQTIAALKMYGLIKDSSGGDSRKVALTEEALRYFRDEREEERAKLARAFALKPKLITALWTDWGPTPPADTIARSHLKAERGLNDQGARSLLAVYKENVDFADLKGHTKPTGEVQGSKMIPALTPAIFDSFFPQRRQAPPKPLVQESKVPAMEGERVVFAEENSPQQYLRLVASGEMDEFLLDALEDYVKRERRRALRKSEIADAMKPNDEQGNVSLMITAAQREQLRQLGHSDEAISNMKPAEAHEILEIVN